MGLLKWLDDKSFDGEVIHDFGLLHESNTDGENITCSLLLCRMNGAEQIAIRHSRKDFFSGGTSYIIIPAEKAEEVASKFSALAAFRHKPSQKP